MAEVLKLRPEAPEGPVLSELRNGILALTLSNPPANALSMGTMALLQAELDRARDDRSVRVVVIAAAGKISNAMSETSKNSKGALAEAVTAMVAKTKI